MFYSIKNKQVSIQEYLKYITQNFGHAFFNINFKNKFFKYLKLNHDEHPSKIDKIFMSLEDYQLWDIEFGAWQSVLSISDTNGMMNSISVRNPLLDVRQLYNIHNPLNSKFYKG